MHTTNPDDDEIEKVYEEQYGLGNRNNRARRFIEFDAKNKLILTLVLNITKGKRNICKAPGNIRNIN